MAKSKVPPQLRAHQFTKGSAKAAKAGAKGGQKSPNMGATPASKKRATKGKRGKGK